jgi:hypothetical protein
MPVEEGQKMFQKPGTQDPVFDAQFTGLPRTMFSGVLRKKLMPTGNGTEPYWFF